jgi:hypothetical protein
MDCKNNVLDLSTLMLQKTRTRDLEEKEQGIKSKEYVEKHLPVGSIATLVSREYNGEKG